MYSVLKIFNLNRIYHDSNLGPQRTTSWLLLAPIDTEKFCSDINDIKEILNEQR
jgi:hypothetical protein